MNIDGLLNRYFNGLRPKIDVFDDQSIQDKVTDGKGMGFGLYSTLCLMRNAGIRLEIHSNKEIEPNVVLQNRANVEEEFNDSFLDTEDMDDLW